MRILKMTNNSLKFLFVNLNIRNRKYGLNWLKQEN